MTVAGKIVKLGSAPSKIVPDRFAIPLASPIFWFIASALNHEERKISYLGNGVFEYYETTDPRTIGYMEAMLGVLPPFVAIVPVFYAVTLFDGVVSVVIALPTLLYLLIVGETMGNVTVEGVGSHD